MNKMFPVQPIYRYHQLSNTKSFSVEDYILVNYLTPDVAHGLRGMAVFALDELVVEREITCTPKDLTLKHARSSGCACVRVQYRIHFRKVLIILLSSILSLKGLIESVIFNLHVFCYLYTHIYR